MVNVRVEPVRTSVLAQLFLWFAVLVGVPTPPGNAGAQAGAAAFPIRPEMAEDLASLSGVGPLSVVLPDGSISSVVLRRRPDPTLGASFVLKSGAGEQALAAPGVVMFRGSLESVPESWVFLGVSRHGVNGLVVTKEQIFIISSGPPGRGEETLVIDPIASGIALFPFRCATEPIGPDAERLRSEAKLEPPCRTIQIAIDTDYELYLVFGGDADAEAAYIATMIAALSEIYERDVNADFNVAYVRIWTTQDDPWDQTTLTDQLAQFRNYWNTNMGHVNRHVAHLLSGRDLGGGVGWIGQLCNDFAYSLAANVNGFFPYPLEDTSDENWDIIVSAHELGHNCGAPHTHEMVPPVDLCGGGDCTGAADGTIMSYCHLCPGGYSNIHLRFHNRSVAEGMWRYLAENTACQYLLCERWVDFNYSGVEDGTRLHPFDTLAEGIASVPTRGQLVIVPGHSGETPLITKPMMSRTTLGTVTIGQ